jgi:hypothetical protein
MPLTLTSISDKQYRTLEETSEAIANILFPSNLDNILIIRQGSHQPDKSPDNTKSIDRIAVTVCPRC